MEKEIYHISTVLLNNDIDPVKIQFHNTTKNEIKTGLGSLAENVNIVLNFGYASSENNQSQATMAITPVNVVNSSKS